MQSVPDTMTTCYVKEGTNSLTLLHIFPTKVTLPTKLIWPQGPNGWFVATLPLLTLTLWPTSAFGCQYSQAHHYQ